jgi:hypothetical protein
MKSLKMYLSFALALVAFAVPAQASAAQWNSGGEPLTETETISLKGGINFVSQSGYFTARCEGAQMEATLEPDPDAEGEITSFSPGECSGGGNGIFWSCQLKSVTANNLPWVDKPVEVSEGAFAMLFDVDLTVKFSDCSHDPWVIKGGVYAWPGGDPGGPFHSFNLEETETLHSGMGPEMFASGYLPVTPADVYGIGPNF